METNGNRMQNVRRYETSFDRQFTKAMRELEILKARRQDDPVTEITQARTTWNPGPFPEKS